MPLPEKHISIIGKQLSSFFLYLFLCSRVADDCGLLIRGGVVASGYPSEKLSHSPSRGHDLGPVVGNVLVVGVARVLQLFRSNKTEHDPKGEEAEHPDHHQDVHEARGLCSVSSSTVRGLLGGVVLWSV